MDIYFYDNYGKLYEDIEHGTAVVYNFKCEYGEVKHQFIKRAVPIVSDTEYFDIVTPYGYGGPFIIKTSDKEKLVRAFVEKFSVYCARENIVSEFVRFHPLLENALDWGGYYDVIYNRHTLAIDLTDENYTATQFNPNCRNMIRKARKKGVAIEVDTVCYELKKFCELYHMTMKKDHASEYYFFPMEYFKSMKDELGENLIQINARLDGEIIATALFMLSDHYMHYHLSATNPDYYAYAANNLILATAAEYGREHREKYLHLGGGLSGSEQDYLFKFKRSFARADQNLKAFYIGKKIWNPEVYDTLCELAQVNSKTEFFPAYRG